MRTELIGLNLVIIENLSSVEFGLDTHDHGCRLERTRHGLGHVHAGGAVNRADPQVAFGIDERGMHVRFEADEAVRLVVVRDARGTRYELVQTLLATDHERAVIERFDEVYRLVGKRRGLSKVDEAAILKAE